MSVERIDHAAEARQIIDTFHAPSPEGAQMITEAQVHAMLALVEQQRIANLIALADHAHARWVNYAGEAGGMGTLFSYPEAENGNMRIRDDIREALGLS